MFLMNLIFKCLVYKYFCWNILSSISYICQHILYTINWSALLLKESFSKSISSSKIVHTLLIIYTNWSTIIITIFFIPFLKRIACTQIVESINDEHEIEKMAYEEKVKETRQNVVSKDAFRVVRIAHRRSKERKKEGKREGKRRGRKGGQKSREKKLKEREVLRVSRSL